MDSSGFARRGQPINLFTNHFKLTAGSVDCNVCLYNVALSYGDGSPVDDGKGIGRKVIDKLQETYDTELAGREFAYDGEKNLFTVGPLPQNKLEFTVILEDLSSNKAAVNGSPVNESSLEVGDRKRSFKVEISIAAKIPMRAIANALCSQESENSLEALRVLDIILRQNAAKKTSNNYGLEALLRSAGVSISSSFSETEGRVLSTPKLKLGSGDDFFPRSGRLNYNHKTKVQPMKIEHWAIVDFSVCGDIKKIWRDIARCGQQKGIFVENPCAVIEEDAQARHAPPLVRVEQMLEKIKSKFTELPRFLLCLLPERKTSTMYGPWKRKTLADFGILTQCISPLRVNDQYLTNVVLKMNAKISRMEASPPPSPLPLNSKHHAKLKLVPMDSSGFAHRGQHITQLTNHFKVAAGSVDGDFYHYNVAVSYDDGSPVDCEGIENKVIDMLRETYDTKLAEKNLAYDGGKSMFTVGPLPQNKLEFTVILEDLPSNKDAVNGIKRPFQSKSFTVEISYVAKIPMRAIANALTNLLSKINAKLSGPNSLLAMEESPSMHTIPKTPTMILRPSIALRGSVIGILIFKEFVISLGDGRGRIDLIAEKRKKEEARKKIAESVPDLFSDDFEEEEEKRKEASKVEEDVEDDSEEYGEIETGHCRKNWPLGNHVFISCVGATKSFTPVWRELRRASKGKSDFYIEEAMLICDNSIKKIPPKEFDAKISLGGYEKDGKPVIVTFGVMDKNGKLEYFSSEERRQLHLVTLGSGSEKLDNSTFSKLDKVKDDGDTSEVCASLAKGIVECSLDDSGIGGFLSGVTLESSKKAIINKGSHVLWYLARFFDDLEPCLNSSLIYKCKETTYNREFEKLTEDLYYAINTALDLGSDFLSTFVLGVDKKANVIVGLMTFNPGKREVALEFLSKNPDLLLGRFEFEIPTKALLQDISKCYRRQETNQDHLL